MENTLINIDVSKLFEVKDYNNEVNLVHFRDQYYKVKEILEETDKFYQNFVSSRLKPLQYFWKTPYITSAIKPYSIIVYRNIVDTVKDHSIYDERYFGRKAYNDLTWEIRRITAEVAKELIQEIKNDESCPFYFKDDYIEYNRRYILSQIFCICEAKLKKGNYPINSLGEIDLWRTKNTWSKDLVKNKEARLRAAKENGFATQKDCQEAIKKFINIYNDKADNLIKERFNNYILTGDLTNKFIIGVKLDELTRIVSTLCNQKCDPSGYTEYLKLITPKSHQGKYKFVNEKGEYKELNPDIYYFKSDFWAKKINRHNGYYNRYIPEDKNDYEYLQLNVDFNITDFFDDTYTRENFANISAIDLLNNPLRPGDDNYSYPTSKREIPLINYKKVQQFVDEYMKDFLGKVYEIIYSHLKPEKECEDNPLYIMYKGNIRYFCNESELPDIKVAVSKDGNTLDCWISRESGRTAWGKHTDTHHNTLMSFDIYTNELINFSDNKYTTSYGVDMDLDDFD